MVLRCLQEWLTLLEDLQKLNKRMLDSQRRSKLHERGLLMFKLKNYKVISLRLRQDLDLVLPPLKLRLPAYWRRMPTRWGKSC